MNVVKKEGYNTKSKSAICKFLEDNKDNAVTVLEIRNYLDSIGESVNATTVYRFLDKLVDEKKILKYIGNDGKTFSYQITNGKNDCDKHLHVKCVNCGKTVHLECDYMKKVGEHIEKHHGFELLCDKTIMYGICNGCKQLKK